MIKRTEHIGKRKTNIIGTETVKTVTYWLFWVWPVYSTETILSSTEV